MNRSIEPTPLPKFSFRNSKRRVYPGSGSTSLFMDPDVIEIPPPIHQPPKLMKQKEVILHDVIDIDNDDDSADLVLVGEKVGKNNKGKTIEGVHDDFADQAVEVSDYIFCPPVMEKFGPAVGIDSSNDFDSVSHNLIDADSHGSDVSCDDDDYSDLFSDDYMDVDEYAFLQAHFDNVDLPPGVEAPIPWLPDAKISHVTDSSQHSWLLEPTNPEIQGSSVGSSSLQIKMDAIDHPSGAELTSQFFSLATQPAPSKKKSAASQHRGCKPNLSLGVEASESEWFLGPFESKKKPNVFGASIKHGFIHSEAMKLPPPAYWGQFKIAKKPSGSSSSYHSNSMIPVDESFHPPAIELANPWLKSAKKADGSSSSYHSNFIGFVDGSFPPPAIELPNPSWKSTLNLKPFPNYTANSSFFNPFVPLHSPPEQVFDNTWVQNSVRDGNNGTAADSTVVVISDEVRDEIMRKFRNFKQFDTVEDTSDHYFFRHNSSMKQHPKNWAKRIQEEWKMLEKDLPDSIFVRIYESRMDLLRAVIIGAEGTPYHDGLFFFDVFFPSGYPNVPPQVHYHSGGLRLNPNLYNCGKVCLSLLNTWSGNKNEKWLPGVSTILQVLVSIQGLILNTKPYFNEPGHAHMNGSASGEMRSLQYNEETYTLSLRTMVYMIRRPPKNFEDFVMGHFCCRAHDILVACKAYMDGAQVGCLVKGGVQDVDEGDKSSSKQFKEALPVYVNLLVREFTQIGAKDCEKFLCPLTIGDKLLGESPEAAT